MKLASIEIKNYRQFKDVVLCFDEGITVLAGANNSGKTSLLTLIKNVFNNEKAVYRESDIPAENILEWINAVYPIFENFFIDKPTNENIENSLVELILPADETKESIRIRTTELKVHVSYDPNNDDIKLFADYIMDLDDNKHDFFFEYFYEIDRFRFLESIDREFEKIKKRFEEIENNKKKPLDLKDEKLCKKIELEERYLKQLIVGLYVKSLVPTCYYCDETYNNRCKMEEVSNFRKLFNFCFIKASRPLDDDSTDHSHSISKQMIKIAELDSAWNALIEKLPDEILKPIQDSDISGRVQETSLKSLKDTIDAIAETNGGKSGELMLDMLVKEDDISDLLQKITTATYCIDGYYLGEESQGLGYSNMIYIHLQLKEYEKQKDSLKVNVFFVEEPESHMHPQMQQVFIKYLFEHQIDGIQGLITTHSNEMVRVAGLRHLRVIRKKDGGESQLHDLSKMIDDLNNSVDKTLANFYTLFFEIGFSELIFADKAVFYEGDTEKMFIRRLLTLPKYKKLSQQYIAYIQVGGAYAKNYKKIIEVLGIKSLIITDIDYGKDAKKIEDIKTSSITNDTIKSFYKGDNPETEPTVESLYKWKDDKKNIISGDLIYTCFQTSKDGYARTLEEAMLSKLFSIDVTIEQTKETWEKEKEKNKLLYPVPKGDKTSKFCIRDIVESTSFCKTDFMHSVILNDKVAETEPDYIEGGLQWLME